MTLHDQVRIEHEDTSAEVDAGIAPLILALWRRGFRTTGSCEHQEGTHVAWIGFESESDAETFRRIVDDASVVGGSIMRPNEEELAAADPDDPALSGAVGVGFLYLDLPAVLAAVTQKKDDA